VESRVARGTKCSQGIECPSGKCNKRKGLCKRDKKKARKGKNKKSCDHRCKNKESKKCKNCLEGSSQKGGKFKRKNQTKRKKPQKTKPTKPGKKTKHQRKLKSTIAENRASINLTCMTTALQLLKFQKDNVNNFLARHVRQQRQGALTAKKLNKKGEYAEPAARLIQAGGGNKSNMTCGGSTTSFGAQQLLNLTNLLDACPTLIKAACAPPAINQTFMEDCFKKSTGYNTTLSGCVTAALKGTDQCACFTDAKLVGAMTNLRPCKGKDEAKLAAASRTKCLNQMKACNGYVDIAGRLQYTCKYTAADLKATLAQVMANNASISAALAKVTELTGVAASSNKSASRHVREAGHLAEDKVKDLMEFEGRHAGRSMHRERRATYTCASMTTAVQTCTTVVSSSPTSTSIATSCTIETTQSSITCTTTEKAALQTVTTSLTSAQLIFTAFAVSLQKELLEADGAEVGATELAALVAAVSSGSSTAVTAAASGRNRNILRKLIMDKMKN